MGVVYLASDERLNRRVALKTMSSVGNDSSARRRFVQEAKAAAAVNHPNVCQIYEIGEDEGEPFIAMELLEGETLSERLKGGPLSVADAMPIALGILAALQALHSRGVVHRDLKPSNVFLTAHGVKLLDFGLARQNDPELATLASASGLTRTGMVLGTPRYMAPEQVTGEGLDARSDIFAVGAILFEMLAGRPAFTGRNAVEILHATLKMDELIRQHGAIMDRYDPEKKLALAVDEWGAWYAPAAGSNPGFLQQQNSLRDALLAGLNLNIFTRHADRVRIANIAQMVNVLQAMILTDDARMLLTPTYHVFRMYVPFQEARVLPLQLDAGTWVEGDLTLPRVDGIAARAADGRLLLAFTHLHPGKDLSLDIAIDDASLRRVSAETLSAARVDSVNTFESPDAVAPKPLSAKLGDGRLRVTLPAKSVSVVVLER